jgi:hypothetical protein
MVDIEIKSLNEGDRRAQVGQAGLELCGGSSKVEANRMIKVGWDG